MIHVLIVATYAAVRAGLHALLADAADMEIIGTVGGSAEWERLPSETPPDVLLVDVTGSDLTRLLELAEEREVGLVVLEEEPDGWRRLAATALPGWGWLGREAEAGEIAGAIRAASAGLAALDRSVMARLEALIPRPAFSPLDEGEAGWSEALTPRESEVLQLMAQGLPNKQIAARLHVSLSTVKFHVASILAKLEAGSRTEAVTLAARRGMLTL